MNFDKESKSEDFFFWGGGEREGGGGRRGIPTRKTLNTLGVCLFVVLMLYIKFQVPGSSCSLDLTQTKGVTNR